MLVLGIETATWTAGVGVVRDGLVLADLFHEERSSHAVSLLGLIDRALQAAGARLEQIDAVAVSIGPGSFTGLRVGLGTAKGLHLSRGLPLVGVPTLLAFACAVGIEDRVLAPWIDARKGEVFAAAYRRGHGGAWAEVDAPRVAAPEALARRLRSDWVVFGTGAWLYRRRIEDQAPGVTILPPERARPSGAAVAWLGGQRLASHGADDPAALEPLYLRPSEAELGRRRGRQVPGKKGS